MYSVYFTATVYNDDGASRVECGAITNVDSYVDAMKRIENAYGNTLEKIEIELFDTDMLIFTPEDGAPIYKLLKDNVF